MHDFQLRPQLAGSRRPWHETPSGYFYTTPTPERWTVGNEHNQVWGADLASAATIAPTHLFHKVTGTTGIDTITPPWTTFAGLLILTFEDAVTVSTNGNVTVGFTTAANETAFLFYNPRTAKWLGAIINAAT